MQRSNDFKTSTPTPIAGNNRCLQRTRPVTGRRILASSSEPNEPPTWGRLKYFLAGIHQKIRSIILHIFTERQDLRTRVSNQVIPRKPKIFETTTTKSPWNIQATAPTITRRQAIGRFYILHCLVSAKVPFVVWGLEALACNFVPTHFRDPLEILVPREYLEEAAKIIENDKYSFYRRIEKFDHVDDYTFPREVSVLVRRNLRKCEYLQTPKTNIQFQPWQIILIPDHIFKFRANASITQGFAQTRRLPAHLGFRGILANVKVPTFSGMLNSIYATIDSRCVDDGDGVMRAQLEEQAEALIMWRIRRDESAEVYQSIQDLPEDLRSIRDGLYPRGRRFFDDKYLVAHGSYLSKQ
ncbi:hypothetical protein TWF679_001755 [Orbilia oligospora]|uniref:Uncharacterized protein n=1 Tax=Orbilia oligospora TaxID=2813651 RepID=A0A8H8UUU8_ORBOL|nr:hypothetical protein TWF679_001755 [Orbilia oligospora]